MHVSLLITLTWQTHAHISLHIYMQDWTFSNMKGIDHCDCACDVHVYYYILRNDRRSQGATPWLSVSVSCSCTPGHVRCTDILALIFTLLRFQNPKHNTKYNIQPPNMPTCLFFRWKMLSTDCDAAGCDVQHLPEHRKDGFSWSQSGCTHAQSLFGVSYLQELDINE